MSLNQNEQSKLEKIYKLYSRDMYRIAFNILHNYEDSNDIVQASIAKIAKLIDNIDLNNINRTKGFIFIIVKNESINLYNKRKSLIYYDDLDYFDSLLSSDDVVSSEVICKENNEYIQRAISSLKEHESQIITLRYYHDLSYKEISVLMECSENTARVILHRAKKSLKKILSEESYSEREIR